MICRPTGYCLPTLTFILCYNIIFTCGIIVIFIEQILLKSVFTGYMYSQITLISKFKLRITVEFHAWVTVVFYSKWKDMVIYHNEKSQTDFPARGPGMYTLLWGIHEVAVAVRWPGKLKSMMAFDRNLPSSCFVVQYNSLILMI